MANRARYSLNFSNLRGGRDTHGDELSSRRMDRSERAKKGWNTRRANQFGSNNRGSKKKGGAGGGAG